jgi:hypothetical protein
VQTGEYTGSADLNVRQITSLKFCWRQQRAGSIYHNWHSIFPNLLDVINANHYNSGSPCESNQEPQYLLEAVGSAAGNELRGVERSSLVDTPAFQL